MIKNQKQAEATRKKIIELKKALEEFEAQIQNKVGAKYRLGKNSFEGLIKDLENQVEIYDCLVDGNFHCWKPESLIDIAKVLISARLAQKMSQKQLADLLDLKEQQIQRYEAKNYETASWPRIVEVAMALNLKFRFEQIRIADREIHEYNYDGKTKAEADAATEKVKKQGLLLNI